MLTLVFILIATNNVNTKLECGNERVEGRVKTHCPGDRHRHFMTTACKSITRTKVFARLLNRIISFHERFGSYAQDTREYRDVNVSNSHNFHNSKKELKKINLRVTKSAVQEHCKKFHLFQEDKFEESVPKQMKIR